MLVLNKEDSESPFQEASCSLSVDCFAASSDLGCSFSKQCFSISTLFHAPTDSLSFPSVESVSGSASWLYATPDSTSPPLLRLACFHTITRNLAAGRCFCHTQAASLQSPKMAAL